MRIPDHLLLLALAAGSMSASGPIDFAGQFALTCTATYCRIPRTIYEVRIEGGALVIWNSGMLTPYVGTTTACGQPALPGISVIAVERQTTVQGAQVPGVVKWTGGDAGGAGEN